MVVAGNARRLSRVFTALVVALFATVASARLFVVDGTQQQRSIADDTDVAGHLDPPYTEEVEAVNPAPEPIAISISLEHSAEVTSYLGDIGLERSEAQQWARLFRRSVEAGIFERGHSLTLYKDPDTGDLRGLKYSLDERVALSELSYGDGVIRSSDEPIRYFVRPVAVSFKLKDDLWDEARRNQLPKPIAATLRYAFSGNHRLPGLPRGSNIKLIYQEKVSRDGTARFVTGLEAAQISFSGKTMSAFAFRDENGQAHLYDINGVALGPETLRFPVAFQYISSGFSLHRYHPILHAYRPHPGVDLASRYGASVKAVADGRVEVAGWCGELGRCIRIQHSDGIVSIYGHLSQISRGVENGKTVRAGEVIGRVGSSGLSTGPHLHYALEKDGRYINPLSDTLAVHHQISPAMRSLFEHFKRRYMATMEQLPSFGGHFMAPRVTSTIGTAKRAGFLEPRREASRPRFNPARSGGEQTAAAVIISPRSSSMR